MMGYSFESLSPLEFEELCRDLLQLELDLTLEGFKAGSDGGVDLRHSRDLDRQLVVQCKHFRGSGYAALRANLSGSEYSKVQALAPKRYILATSVDLSPRNKAQLVDSMAPHIRSPQDIYGASDLNGLLGKFPRVERRHFKLWLASVEALDRLFGRGTHVRSESLVARAKSKLKLYARTEAFERALEMLQEEHACVIAGPPGVGKTTLADVLMVHHLEQGFEVVEVSEDIAQADEVYRADARQFFYYDDFLGTAFDEWLPKNEDSRLANFMSRVAAGENKRLVMTTREYILQGALRRYEKLAVASSRSVKCVLSVADFTQRARGRILYNHLYFSSLPPQSVAQLIRDGRHRDIVKHPNFSPRIVEHAIRRAEGSGIKESELSDFLIGALDNPTSQWEYAFENHLPREAQCLLLALLFLPGSSYVEDVLRTTREVGLARDGRQIGDPEARAGLKILDGTFVTLKRHRMSPRRQVEFSSPAVRDYLLHYLDRQPAEVAPLLESSRQFEQVVALCSASITSGPEVGMRFPRLLEALVDNAKLLCSRTMALFGAPARVPSYLNVRVSYEPQPTEDARLAALARLVTGGRLPGIAAAVENLVVDAYQRWKAHDGDRSAIAQIVGLFEVPEDVLGALASWAELDLDSADDFSLIASLHSTHGFGLSESVEEAFLELVSSTEEYILRDADSPEDVEAAKEEIETLGGELGLQTWWNDDLIDDRLVDLQEGDGFEFDYDRAVGAHVARHGVASRSEQEFEDLFVALLDHVDSRTPSSG